MSPFICLQFFLLSLPPSCSGPIGSQSCSTGRLLAPSHQNLAEAARICPHTNRSLAFCLWTDDTESEGRDKVKTEGKDNEKTLVNPCSHQCSTQCVTTRYFEGINGQIVLSRRSLGYQTHCGILSCFYGLPPVTHTYRDLKGKQKPGKIFAQSSLWTTENQDLFSEAGGQYESSVADYTPQLQIMGTTNDLQSLWSYPRAVILLPILLKVNLHSSKTCSHSFERLRQLCCSSTEELGVDQDGRRRYLFQYCRGGGLAFRPLWQYRKYSTSFDGKTVITCSNYIFKLWENPISSMLFGLRVLKLSHETQDYESKCRK